MNRVKVYSVPEAEKEAVRKRLRESLERYPELSFAYLHGSFKSGVQFRDVDVAVYLKGEVSQPVLEYELCLESELMTITGRYPVDVRVLNKSPLSFRYRVIKEGILLFAKNDDERADFQEATLSAYFDFAPYRNLYLKETLGSGV